MVIQRHLMSTLRLRSKIETDPANPLLIQTIRGLGYKFEA